jgi:hypothetical protein
MLKPVRVFVRHYLEMVVAMFAGMFVLGGAIVGVLELATVDVSSWETTAPAVLLLGMAFTMSAGMVAWMRYRGHGWAPCAEMTAAMFVPSLVVVGLLAGGVRTDFDALLEIQHVAMFPSMLVAMLLRHREYTDHAAVRETGSRG